MTRSTESASRSPSSPSLPFLLGGMIVLGAALGCGGGSGVVLRPGLSFGAVPTLSGVSVMVFPVQIRDRVPSSVAPDAELAFALRERGSAVRWLFPDTLRTITARNPGIDVPLRGLRVGVFLRTRVQRVGDPLFGQLRRLNALTGAPVALIPVHLRYRPVPETLESGEVLEPAMELSAALIDARNGRVFWFGVVDGETGGADDPRTLASAVDALARAVAR